VKWLAAALLAALVASALYWSAGLSSAGAQGQNQPEFQDAQGNSTLRYDFRMLENADGSGTPVPVGSVVAVDPQGDDLTYELDVYDGTDFPPAPLFSIDSDGELSYTGDALDYESLLQEGEDGVIVQTLDVTATDPDGYWSTAEVIVHLDDVEMPARMSAPAVEYAAAKTGESD